MKRISSIQSIDHPILGNLTLDFCDRRGRPVNTVILAGENGAGKVLSLKLSMIWCHDNREMEDSTPF